MKSNRKRSGRFAFAVLAMAALVLTSFAGCADEAEAPVGNESVYDIRFAKQFAIEYRDSGVRIVRDSAGDEMLLLPEGAAAPDDKKDLPSVRIPIEKGVFLSTTQVGLMEPLGEAGLYDTIIGVATDPSTWTTEEILDRQDEIAWVRTTNNALDVELIISLHPDIVFLDTGMGNPGQSAAQLAQAGIPCFQTSDYLEEGAIAYLEWTKLYGAFYCLDENADIAVKEAENSLAELKAKTADIREEDRPLVAYGLYSNGTVYTPGADSVTAAVIQEAGGRYYLTDVPGTGSIQLTMEEFFAKARDADVYICTSMVAYTPDKQTLLEANELFGEMKAVKEDNVYVLSTGYYMNAAQVVTKFQDQIAFIQPSLGFVNSGMFFEKLN